MKTKNDFKSTHDWIKYGLKNNISLGNEEYVYVFKHMEKKSLSPKHDSLRRAIIFLLNELEDKELQEVLNLLNTDFKFKHKYTLNIETLKKEFNSYSYKCLNNETALHLVKLADEVKTKKQNACVEEHKSLYHNL